MQAKRLAPIRKTLPFDGGLTLSLGGRSAGCFCWRGFLSRTIDFCSSITASGPQRIALRRADRQRQRRRAFLDGPVLWAQASSRRLQRPAAQRSHRGHTSIQTDPHSQFRAALLSHSMPL